MPQKLCTHFQKYKAKEKICNMLKKKKNFNNCETDPSHQEDLWFCIDCGHIACSKFSDYNCIEQHYNISSKKHKLAISLDKLFIYCFECQDDLESILLEHEESPQTEKLQNFVDSLKQSFFKVLKSVRTSKNPPKIIKKQESDEEEKQQNSDKPKKLKLTENPKSIFGLENIGNTCFFNSVLQCLNGTQELREFYINQDKNDFQDEFKIYEQDSDDEEKKQDYIISGIEDDISYKNTFSSFPKNKEKNKNKGGKNKKNKKSSGAVIDCSKQYEQKQFQTGQPKNQSIKRINQQFQRLLLDGFQKNKKSINPQGLYSNISVLFTRFMTFSQEDAQELLRCLLDSLSLGEEKWFKIDKSQEKKSKMKKRETHIEKTFGGYLVNYLKCLECKEISRTFDFFMDLSVQIPGSRQIVKEQQRKRRRRKSSNNQTEDQQSQSSKKEELQEELKQQEQDQQQYQNDIFQYIPQEELKKTKIPEFDPEKNCLYEPSVYQQDIPSSSLQETTIEQCLNEFASFELLNQSENYFKCDYCNDSQKALRKFYIYEPPKVLNIALKRFVFSGDGMKKNCKKVKFGEFLNIDSYSMIKGNEDEDIEDDVLTGEKKLFNYELYGVVQHQGSMDFGHYIAFVKHKINGNDHWFQFNDSIVSETTFKTVQNSEAYLLFYRRISN